MPIETRQFIVPEGQAARRDRWVQQLTGLSRSAVRGLFDHGCVSVQEHPCDQPGQWSAAGETIVVQYDPQRRYHELPPAPQASRMFRLVYEDKFLIVVDKVAGVLTVPTERREDQTLVHALATHLSRGGPLRRQVEVVHRLDRDTSGLLVFARQADIAQQLQDQFADRKPEREYLAIVARMMEEPEGTIRSRLATNKGLGRYSTQRGEDGEMAITHFRVIDHVRDATFLRVWLETGRRNQIRVHLAERGHPVLGDDRYRPELARHPDWTYRRLALHASVLGFRHPISGESLRFESPIPSEFRSFLGGSRPRPATPPPRKNVRSRPRKKR